MNDDEISSKVLAEIVVGADLSLLSIDELQKRIILFEQEIGRLKKDIEVKELSKAAAESIFRS